ncbi:fungal specific transcription factor [Ceraceosorus bombacis]|uniref:Fungal specific transcription factor n=1 Tax=Ceraceosorus bombacis TaxID=401625 RepID=A0A0P1BR37_9BASI|nr:fungal specific transcription factor [Ceraceosorus bombacis]
MSYYPSEPEGSASWNYTIQPRLSREQVSPTDTSHGRPASLRAAVPDSDNVKKRGRITMACLHCRQRKIKCDGGQPACSTCTRLRRDCVYEAVPEEENVATRERKRLGKEAKESRLAALARLGIMLPPSSGSMGAPAIHQSGPTRSRPRPMRSTSGRDLAAPYPRIPSEEDPAALHSQHQSLAHSVRRRGVTIGGHEVVDPSSGPFPHRTTLVRFDPSDRLAERPDQARAFQPPPSPERWSGYGLSSLSQPSTPEETYMLHASMLQSDLATPATPSDVMLPSPWGPPAGLPAQATMRDIDSTTRYARASNSGTNSLNASAAPTPDAAVAALPGAASYLSPKTTTRAMPSNYLRGTERDGPNSWSRPPTGSVIDTRRRSSYDSPTSDYRRPSRNQAAIYEFFSRVVAGASRPSHGELTTAATSPRSVRLGVQTDGDLPTGSGSTAWQSAWPPLAPNFQHADSPKHRREISAEHPSDFNNPWLSANDRSASGSTLVSITGTDAEQAGGSGSSASSASRGARGGHITAKRGGSQLSSSGRNSTSSATSVPTQTDEAAQAYALAMAHSSTTPSHTYLAPADWSSRQNSLGGSPGGSNNSGHSSGLTRAEAQWLAPPPVSGAPSPDIYWAQPGSAQAQHQLPADQRQPSLVPSLGHRQSFAGVSGELPFWLSPERDHSAERDSTSDMQSPKGHSRRP